jgi:hypothetical protein
MNSDNSSNLYSESYKQILKNAEDSLNPAPDRVNEIIYTLKRLKLIKYFNVGQH